MAKVISVSVVSNVEEVKAEVRTKVLAALEAIGETAAAAAATPGICPVDTGRLRNSISSAVDANELVAYIGTNVEYAAAQELGTSKGIRGKHFLQYGAQSTWVDSGKDMLESALRSE